MRLAVDPRAAAEAVVAAVEIAAGAEIAVVEIAVVAEIAAGAAAADTKLVVGSSSGNPAGGDFLYSKVKSVFRSSYRLNNHW
jgi:hypothetical protein